ncbi:MAG TPA: prolyl oligopeptidase family serine peptidase [Opitutaceae bacterium]|nr:prolyl oligopeptidase family serine peptidase [Opitutaceae bacterium]
MHRLPLSPRLVWLLAGLLGSVRGADQTPIPIKSFFGLPEVSAPRLSPDGKKIAFLFPHEGKLALGVFERGSKESRLVLRGENESIATFFWKGNDRIVFAADYQGNESLFIGSTDLTGKNVVRIVETQPDEYLIGSAGVILDSLPAVPDQIAITGILRPTERRLQESSLMTFLVNVDFVVATVNVRNRGVSPHYVYHGPDRVAHVEVDNAGVMRVRARLEHGRDLVWEHREADDKSWREIARHPFHGYAETWEPQRFAADNTTLWLVSREEHDRGALYAYNTRTQERGPALFVPPAGEIENIIVSHDRSRLLGVSYQTERLQFHWFDPARAALQAKMENTFRGTTVQLTSTSVDEQVAMIHVSHDREPGTYFVLDQKEGSLVQFKRTRDLDPARLSPRRPVVYKARDGLELQGYLTIPAGSEGKRVPLVMHPHGGPFGVRDTGGYDPDAQFLASRGYAVLQPNYRGSGGYGRAFVDKGRQQWGRAMQDDLTDGVKWAIEQGIADPKRVAIYGASYGGYATLAGLTLTPELYCCGINYVGASDLEITFKQRGEDAYRRPGDFSYRDVWVGPTAEYRAATSPIHLVDRIRVPTLHGYGENDPRVKFDHWTRLEPQLKKFKKTYDAIIERRQGHGFRDEKASVGFYSRLDTFLAENLAPVRK